MSATKTPARRSDRQTLPAVSVPTATILGHFLESPQESPDVPLQARRNVAALTLPQLLDRAGDCIRAVQFLGRLTAEQLWLAGEALAQAKLIVDRDNPGTWQATITEAGIPESTDRQARRLAKEFPDPVALRGKTITEAKIAAGIVKPRETVKKKPVDPPAAPAKPQAKWSEGKPPKSADLLWDCLTNDGAVKLVWAKIEKTTDKYVQTADGIRHSKADNLCRTQGDALKAAVADLDARLAQIDEQIAGLRTEAKGHIESLSAVKAMLAKEGVEA